MRGESTRWVHNKLKGKQLFLAKLSDVLEAFETESGSTLTPLTELSVKVTAAATWASCMLTNRSAGLCLMDHFPSLRSLCANLAG
jgi:hypothetical protein